VWAYADLPVDEVVNNHTKKVCVRVVVGGVIRLITQEYTGPMYIVLIPT